MPLRLPPPIIYLITKGATNAHTTSASEEFASVLELVSAAVAANVSLIQIREKNLTARVLQELVTESAKLTRSTQTRLLVNDRADIARATGADGVHLTARSLAPAVVRRTFGPDFLIGVSTHSVAELRQARDQKADFAVFGPVFATESKRSYGEPLGSAKLAEVVTALTPFPILAIGGVTLDSASSCFNAGAVGVAAIGIFQHGDLAKTVNQLRHSFERREK
jgi:thiamine-phosphate pyrophosphorylase